MGRSGRSEHNPSARGVDDDIHSPFQALGRAGGRQQGAAYLEAARVIKLLDGLRLDEKSTANVLLAAGSPYNSAAIQEAIQVQFRAGFNITGLPRHHPDLPRGRGSITSLRPLGSASTRSSASASTQSSASSSRTPSCRWKQWNTSWEEDEVPEDGYQDSGHLETADAWEKEWDDTSQDGVDGAFGTWPGPSRSRQRRQTSGYYAMEGKGSAKGAGKSKDKQKGKARANLPRNPRASQAQNQDGQPHPARLPALAMTASRWTRGQCVLDGFSRR